VMGRRGRRREQTLDDFKGKRGYWEWKEEVLDRNAWRTRCGIGYGPVVRLRSEWMNRRKVVEEMRDEAVCYKLQKLRSVVLLD
jgi:hypothetical protein